MTDGNYQSVNKRQMETCQKVNHRQMEALSVLGQTDGNFVKVLIMASWKFCQSVNKRQKDTSSKYWQTTDGNCSSINKRPVETVNVSTRDE